MSTGNGKASCCGIPYAPEWETQTDGDYAFISVCPKCGQATECHPHGNDMQALHRILRSGNKPPSRKPHAQQNGEAPVSPEESADAATALRIWTDFRWWTKKADRSYAQIEAELAKCIHRCKQEIKTESIRQPALEKFQQMKNRISEFTCDPPQE